MGGFKLSKKILILSIIFTILFSGLAIAQTEVTVSTIDQFLNAIGSNKRIIMEKGFYNFDKASIVKNKNLRYEKKDNGYQITIIDVENLEIWGKENGVNMVGSIPSAYTLSFDNCIDVLIESINIDHASGKGGSAGAISIHDSTSIDFYNCGLTGAGNIGLYIDSCESVYFEEGYISGFSKNAVFIMNSYDVYFDYINFDSNQSYPLINILSSDYLSFYACYMTDNIGDSVINISGEYEPEDIYMNYCEFTENAILYFSTGQFIPYLENSYFDANLFVIPEYNVFTDDGEYSDYEENQYYFHDASGLEFLYPYYWMINTDGSGETVSFYKYETDNAVLVFPLYTMPKNEFSLKIMKSKQSTILKEYLKIMKTRGKFDISAKVSGNISENKNIIYFDYFGTGFYNKKKLFIWTRFVLTKDGKVFALSAASDSEEQFQEGMEIDTIINSISGFEED